MGRSLHFQKIPKLGLILVQTWVCLLPSPATAQVPGGFEPRLLRVAGIPEEAHEFWQAELGAAGWVAACAGGFVKQEGTSWVFHRSPDGGETRVVLPFQDGYVVAGAGFCAVFSSNGWHRFAVDDRFQTGAMAGDDVVLTGQRGIYHLGPEGKLTLIQTRSGAGHAGAFLIHGSIVVFDDQTEPKVWHGGRLRPTGSEFAWAKACDVGPVTEESGGYIAIADKGVFEVTARGVATLLPEHWKEWWGSGLVGGVRVGDQLVIATFYGGVMGYDSSGKVVWRISPKSLKGGVYFLQPCSEGFLIGSTGGLYVLQDPTRFGIATVPDDVFFCLGSATGVLVGSSAGVTYPDGKVAEIGGKPFSLVETSPGHFIEGRFGGVAIDGRLVPMDGREVFDLAVSGTCLAGLQPEGLSLVTLGEAPKARKVTLPGAVNSVAAVRGGFLAGGSAGAYHLTDGGEVVAHFGAGRTRACSLQDDAVAIDSTGMLFDSDGKTRQRLPVTGVLASAERNGELYVLARPGDGPVWAGKIDVARGQWVPFDLDLPSNPAGLACTPAGVFVLSSGQMLWVRDPPVLPTPSADVRLQAPGLEGSTHGAALSSRESSVQFVLPPPRLSAGPSVSYFCKVGDGEWTGIGHYGTNVIDRLPWGRTQIAFRAESGGLSATNTLRVTRAWPWYLRSPLWILYPFAAGALLWGGVRWRTRQLARRAKTLEAVVASRTAELRQAQRAREEFFSTLSHEIRNPLNGVVGLCEILGEAPAGAVGPRERMYVATLHGCAQQLRTMLGDVLDFSRIDRGEIQINEEVFNLPTATEVAIRGIDATMEHCILTMSDGVFWLRGDAGKITQIVTNLVSNALKYGVPPHARVDVAIAPEPEEQVNLTVTVSNTGPTISPEDLTRIFDGFFRGSEATRRRIPGSGIGLAVSRRMAEAMGGTLAASSGDGLTEFCLKLRLRTGTAPSSVVMAPRAKVARALAIEDEAYNRHVLGYFLSQFGYEVDWAVDGASALERIRSVPYDLVLTDFMLPDITGPELAKRILAEAREPKPPIIAVTAYSTPERIAEAKAAGIRQFVTKPIDRQKLEAAILGVDSPGTAVTIRTPQPPPLVVQCDFASLLSFEEGHRLLADYASGLAPAWREVATAIEDERNRPSEARARAVHAFRSRILVSGAHQIAEQLSVLEDAVRAERQDDVSRIASLIGPLVDDLAAAARGQAMSTD